MTSPKDLSDIFGRFFVVAGYLPALGLLTLIRLLIFPGLPMEIQNQVSLISQVGYVQEITVLVIIPVFLAAILVSLTDTTVKLYSGHEVFDRNTEQQSEKYQEFNKLMIKVETLMNQLPTDPSLADRLQQLLKKMRQMTGGAIFFEPIWLRTTRLGNVLASLDEYPNRRYGMNAGTVWPRLRDVLPKEFEERLKSQNTSFMLLLNLSFCCLVFALAWILFGIASLAGWSQVNALVWIIVFISSCGGAYLFYRAAVMEASILVETMTTAFDLYRGSLLEKLGLILPSNINHEKTLWGNLTAFLLLGDERFAPSKSTPPAKEPPKRTSLFPLLSSASAISVFLCWLLLRRQKD